MTIERDNWFEAPLALMACAGWMAAFVGGVWLVNQIYVLGRLLQLAWWFQ